MKRRAAYAVEVGVALVVLVCGLADFAKQILTPCPHALPSIWHDTLWPFHVAVFFFLVQVAFCGRIAMMLQGISRVFNIRQREIHFIVQVQHVLVTMAGSGLLSGIFYAIALQQKSWLVLRGRCLLWSISAPCQLLIAAKLHSTAPPHECLAVVIPSHICMVMGLVSFNAEGQLLQVSQFGLRHLCYLIAVLCMLTSLKRLFSLPPEPTMKPSRQTVFHVTVVLWFSYPAANVARSLGLLTAWQEQVLILTALDVASKTFLMLSMFSEPLFALMISVSGNLQFVCATTDETTAVDSRWVLTYDLLTFRAGMDFMNSIVSSDEERRALLLAGQAADKQGHIVAQKVVLTLQMESDRTLHAECLVSRCIFGRRNLSFVLLEEVSVPTAVQNPHTSMTWPQHPLVISLPSRHSNSNSAKSVRSSATELSTARRQLIITWCRAARKWGQRYLVPDARPTHELLESCLELVQQLHGQRFIFFEHIQLEGLSLNHQWEQLWAHMEVLNGEDEDWHAFASIVDALSHHLWPWFGRSVMIYAREPFSEFHANGSHSGWSETRTTCSGVSTV
mmetsp:Transcript_75665/g.131112  ORF Transcript_75665/g.131112 Transcript_75665/m.131112 type:complete len:563 (-) Transcript_75665:82-1770(-)